MSYRHDWYQTDEKVVITILMKNASEKNCKIFVEQDQINVIADDYSLNLMLFEQINIEKSTYRVSPVKIEINLFKLIGRKWDNLTKPLPVDSENIEPVVATRKPTDWDKMAKEIDKVAEEEKEGEEALNSLFKKIYQDSPEDVRRAMNKSYQESGGTVLSTNWKEVGDKTVEVRPPDGTEYKKW